MEDSRGFEKFVGKTIVSVDSSSINVVHFTFSDGTVVSVDAEESHYGIPILAVNEDWIKL